MPRGLLRLPLRHLSQRRPAQKCQRRSLISTMRMRTTWSALAGRAPPSPLLPHRPPHRRPHQLSPQPPLVSVSILPPLPGAYAFAELAGVATITAAASVQRVLTVRGVRCTCVARVSLTNSGSSSEVAACSDLRRGPIFLQTFFALTEDKTRQDFLQFFLGGEQFGFDPLLYFVFSCNEQ